MTKTQLNTQQHQREVLRQLAAEHSYDPTGKRKVIKYLNTLYLSICNHAPGRTILCLLKKCALVHPLNLE